jgi:predicted DNA-binding protein YlxM (UPF0122 family)
MILEDPNNLDLEIMNIGENVENSKDMRFDVMSETSKKINDYCTNLDLLSEQK